MGRRNFLPTISFRVQRADLERWLEETMPVLLILYDAKSETAYWNYIQAHYAAQTDWDFTQIGRTEICRCCGKTS